MNMEPWAKRIFSLLTDRGESQVALANACGIREPSVSGWFGKGSRPTRMISGDNLVAAAKFLETTPEWIMTGREGVTNQSPKASQSQPARLDPAMIAETAKALRIYEHRQGRRFNIETDEGAALFMHWLAVREQLPDVETLSNLIRMGADFTPQGATADGRDKGVPTAGTNEQKPAKRGARKEA